MARHDPTVILVRPSEEGNVGAVARAMANCGLTKLVVVEPGAPFGETARAFAVGAKHVLDTAKRLDSFDEAIAPFHRLVGTSSHRQRQTRIPTLAPRELPRSLSPPPVHSALVFGPERSGLTTEELARCHLLVRIPAAARQPTFNLAQAVLIVAYELMTAALDEAPDEPDAPRAEAATVGEVEAMLGKLRVLLHRVQFARDDTFESVFRDLRRLVARARLSKREVQIVRGLMRRTEHSLKPAGGRRR
jgi:TrmH family RNA methyltransferase